MPRYASFLYYYSTFEIFICHKNGVSSNLISGAVRIYGGRGERNFKISVNISNEWKKRHKCLILMLNLKVSKQATSEASKNKVIIKTISNILMNSVNLRK